jgi:hypothetical protein
MIVTNPRNCKQLVAAGFTNARMPARSIRKHCARPRPDSQSRTYDRRSGRILFQTAPASRFRAAEVLEWYSVRWQIEMRNRRTGEERVSHSGPLD